MLALGCLAVPILMLTGCGEQVATVEKAEVSTVDFDGKDGKDGEEGADSLDPLPPAPESQVLDDGRVFSHAPGKLAELVKYLRELREDKGIEIFVAMYGFLDGETVERRANRLRKAWADRNTGVVVVYESGSEGMSFVATDEIDAALTRHDINMILQQAGKAAQEQKGAENQIEAAVHTLADSLVSKLDHRKLANELTSKKRLLVVSTTLACVILMALIGIVVTRFINRAERKEREFYYFPNARVGTRYGAAFSGGTGAEIRFK